MIVPTPNRQTSFSPSQPRKSPNTLGAPTNMAATQDWPYDPASSATKTERRIWEKEVDESVRKKAYLDKNLKTQYSLVRGQCTDVIQARIEALDGH
jgi:hypothetical protein